MLKILFLCHGNICRSPMAEYIFKKSVSNAGREAEFEIDSAAVSREEIGNDIYPPAKQILREKNIPFGRHAAKQVTEENMRDFDLVIIMDRQNREYLRRLFGGKYMEKVHMLMEYTGDECDVSDPWYSGDFTQAYNDIYSGCEALIASIRK